MHVEHSTTKVDIMTTRGEPQSDEEKSLRGDRNGIRMSKRSQFYASLSNKIVVSPLFNTKSVQKVKWFDMMRGKGPM